MKRNTQGFTLIELMIVVAILGVLSAIALPSYGTYMQEGRRAKVQHLALQKTAILERQYTRLGGYPAVFAPVSDFYSFSYTAEDSAGDAAVGNNGTSFTLTFEPTSGTAQVNDMCKEMSINHQGLTTTSAGANMLDECWP